jgi:hypothetical protein
MIPFLVQASIVGAVVPSFLSFCGIQQRLDVAMAQNPPVFRLRQYSSVYRECTRI